MLRHALSRVGRFVSRCVSDAFSHPEARSGRKRLSLEPLESREVPANLVVNSTADSPDPTPGDGSAWTGNMVGGQQEVTLRSAIMEINATGAPPPGQKHIITFNGIPPVAVPIGGGPVPPIVISLASALPAITNSVQIAGLGPNALTIARVVDNTKSFRLFEFAASSDSIVLSLTLTGGYHPNGTGGAVDNSGKLTIMDCILTNNRAGTGGAIGNHANGDLTINLSDIYDNHATAGDGGGLFQDGNALARVNDSQIRLNDTGAAGRGGGIASVALSKLNLFNVTVTGNFANAGGGIYASLPSGQPRVTVLRSTFSCNWCTTQGGAVYLSTADAIFEDVSFDNNSAASGGAIETRNNTLVLRRCTFLDNVASVQGPRLNRLGVLGQNLFITVDSCTGLTQAEVDNAAAV